MGNHFSPWAILLFVEHGDSHFYATKLMDFPHKLIKQNDNTQLGISCGKPAGSTPQNQRVHTTKLTKASYQN